MVQPLPPFMGFVNKTIPTAFENSMSYYDTLCVLYNYLNDTILPQINEDIENIEELTTLCNELKDYVDNYFDNLDVQEEINNKLDDMVEDGTLKSILNNDLLQEINNKILQNTVDISANTEAIAGKVSQGEASSITMEMLTQDVREALTGGSTAVVAEDSVDTVNIVDKAVTILKLDDYLQATKVVEAGEPISLGVKSGGIAQENSSTHKIEINSPTSTAYSWYKVALTKGKYYYFTGYSYAKVSFYIADASDNVIYNGAVEPSSYTFIPTSILFRANDANLYAYIDISETVYNANYRSIFRVNTPLLREVTDIENLVHKLSPTLIKTKTDGFLNVGHVQGYDDKLCIYDDYTDHVVNINIKFYQMCKGVRYHIVAPEWSYACGIYLLNLKNEIIYQSNDENVGNNIVWANYTFTASQDGYICVHDVYHFNSNNYLSSVEIVQPFGDGGSSDGELSFSKWYALGDSLTEKNFRASENYVDYITEELDITSVNLGHSGSGYKKQSSGTTITDEIASITSYNYGTDIITVMGSINDFSYIADNLGELGDTTTDTIYGAMYVFFNTLQTEYMGTRLGVITPPVIGTSYDAQRDKFDKYNKALKETAELFGVPVLDLTYSCNLKPWETNFRNEFYSADGEGGTGQVDSTHPNSKGHWLIHNKIKEFLKSL